MFSLNLRLCLRDLKIFQITNLNYIRKSTPETLKMMFVKIEGEKQTLLDEFKKYVENKYLNGKKID